MKFKRVWAMPTPYTFDCPPIGAFVKKYLQQSRFSIDPFAGNKRWATITNDLNPKYDTDYHMDARDFLEMLVERGVKADLVIFDPPYSPTQVKEHYEGIGLKFGQEEAWRTHAWTTEKELVDRILVPGGVFLHFGWNTVGMGKNRHYVIEEILLVCHGPGHNDTICMAERKKGHQVRMDEIGGESWKFLRRR